MDPEDPDSDPDHFEKVNQFTLLPFQAYPENSSKSLHTFLSYVVLKQTHKRKHNLTQTIEKSMKQTSDELWNFDKC